MRDDLARLQRLAEMVKSHELAALGSLKQQAATLSSRIRDHRDAESQQAAVEYFQSGSAEKWALWRQQEIARLNVTLAGLRVDIEAAESKTRIAVARVQVLEKLIAERLERPKR